MRRLKGFTLLILLFSWIYAGAQKSFVTAAPYTIAITQPDGTKLDIRGIGDEHRHLTVTSDGYTVLKNPKGSYEFARIGENDKLDFSGVRAHNVTERDSEEKSYLKSIRKFLKEPQDIGDPKFKSAKTILQDYFPAKGTQKTLLLLIEYPDLNHTYTKNNFEKLMNQHNYSGNGSFHDYFYQASNGKLSLSVDVFGWYAARNNYVYYGEDNGDNRARELVAEAVDAAEDAGVDFSDYDNDGDGYVDNLIIAHSGPGAEEGSQTEYIWSHSWSLGSYSRFYDGVTIQRYVMQPETRSYGMVGIGVFCHEFGHALGLPDLYDTDDSDGDSEGLGEWCLMASGSWLNNEKTPAMLSAWGREELGWIDPVVIDSDGDYSLGPSATNDACYKMLTPESNEYFLLENRYATGFDAALPGTGLAIFHVNTRRSNNDNEELKLSDLEEADGYDDLDKNRNRGDGGDLFPGSSVNTLFNDLSVPDAKNYNGHLSGISIYNIQKEGTLLTFSTGKPAVHGIDLTTGIGLNKLAIEETLVNIDIQVTNEGDQTSGEFEVAFYLSENRNISVSDIFMGAETILSLNSGDSRNIFFSGDVREITPHVSDGTYYVGCIIDYQNDIEEASEENNQYVFSYPLVNINYKPELTYITDENRIEISSTDIDIFCQLTNTGETESPRGEIGYYLSDNSSLSTSDYFLGKTEFNSIAIGETLGCSFSKQIASLEGQLDEGDYYVGYVIDYNNSISELNENNNQYLFSGDIFHYCLPDVTFLSELLCSGDSVVYDNEIIKKSGVYEFDYINQNGCDSVIIMDVTVNPSYDVAIAETVCLGDSVMLGRRACKDPGIYSENFSNIYGCDSTVTLYLDVIEPVENYISKNICSGDSVEVAGIFYKSSGLYTHSLVSHRGCDSTVIMDLTVNQPSDTLLTRTICGGDSVIFGDRALKETGVFQQVLSNRQGCDSLVTLDLIVNPEQEIFLEKTICPGDSVRIGSFVYKESGIFENTFSNCFGCDSLVNLQLNIAPLPEIDLGPDRIMYTSEVVLLDAGPGYMDYKWSTGQEAQVLPVNKLYGTGPHEYKVTVTNSYGCSASDDIVITIYDDTYSVYDLERNLKIFPNPSAGIVNFLIKQIEGKYQVTVNSENGTKVYQKEFTSPGSQFVKQIDLSFLTTGFYSVYVHSSDQILAEKLMILKN